MRRCRRLASTEYARALHSSASGQPEPPPAGQACALLCLLVVAPAGAFAASGIAACEKDEKLQRQLKVSSSSSSASCNYCNYASRPWVYYIIQYHDQHG